MTVAHNIRNTNIIEIKDPNDQFINKSIRLSRRQPDSREETTSKMISSKTYDAKEIARVTD